MESLLLLSMPLSHAPDSTGNAIADLSDAGIIGSNDACGFVGTDAGFDFGNGITEIDVFPSVSLSGQRVHTVERRTRPRMHQRPVRVLTYGTFDLFHIGHLRLLERLRGLGDHLTVAVSTDEFNALKGKSSIVPYADRAAIVANCRFVDAVIPEASWDQKAQDVARYSIDIFGMGDDWAGKFDALESRCKVVYLPRTNGISSTSIKERLKLLDADSLTALKSAIEVAQQVLSRLA
jgi:glycerol-3-phosphate cytidylyltransferase